MKQLLSALRGFGKGEQAVAASFSSRLAALTVNELGSYVSGTALQRRAAHPSFDIGRQVFPLDASLRTLSVDSSPMKASLCFDTISCCTLFEDKAATLCWFVVPPGETLPLHDHPCMRVWQRVMYGELHVTALDWVSRSPSVRVADATSVARSRRKHGGEAVVVFNQTVIGCTEAVEAGSITCFDPIRGGGVAHEIHNAHPTHPALFVDIIAPPYYKPPDEWPCTYYDTAVAGDDSPANIRTLSVGEVVTLRPRSGFGGPPMEPYVRVSPRE